MMKWGSKASNALYVMPLINTMQAVVLLLLAWVTLLPTESGYIYVCRSENEIKWVLNRVMCTLIDPSLHFEVPASIYDTSEVLLYLQ